MRVANITTVIAVALWLGMFAIGRDLAYGIYTHGAGVFPSAGQFDNLVVFPIAVAAFLMCAAWVANVFGRWPAILLTVSSMSFLVLFAYLLVYGGGV